jgi:predicted nucleotidyltransferase
VRTVDDILPRQAAAELRDYKRAVERALPGVERLILFGSRARGQAHADSDYDVAVVVRDLSDRGGVRRTLSDLAYEHILNGFYIRPIPLPPGDLDTRDSRPTELAEEIIRDGAEVT